MSKTAGSLEELADEADAALAALTQRRTFEEARAALNEAGMPAARQRLVDALKRISKAQANARAASETAKQYAGQVDAALVAAEWDLDSQFVAEGNKTFLVLGDERRPMTADERAKWKSNEARKQPAVRDALNQAAAAELAHAAARDELVMAEKAFSACRADLDAAIATVGLFAQALPKGTEQS